MLPCCVLWNRGRIVPSLMPKSAFLDMYWRGRTRRRDGGGVCIYIKDNLVFNRRLDLESDNTEFLASSKN